MESKLSISVSVQFSTSDGCFNPRLQYHLNPFCAFANHLLNMRTPPSTWVETQGCFCDWNNSPFEEVFDKPTELVVKLEKSHQSEKVEWF